MEVYRKIKKKEFKCHFADAFHKLDHGYPYNRYPVGVIEYDDGELEFIELKHTTIKICSVLVS